MCQWLKQSTAITLRAGPFVDITDGLTLETGLTLDQADTRLSKAGGDFAQKTESTSATHDENGWYLFLLDGTDTATLGMLTVNFIDAGARPVSLQFMVVPANVWDSMFGADVLNVDLTQMGGVAQSAQDLKDFADDGYDPVTNKVQGVVLTDTCTTSTDMVGTDSAALASVLGAAVGADISADIAAVKVDTAATLVDTAELGAAVGASLSADIAAVKTDTAELGSAVGADLSADIAAVKADTVSVLAGGDDKVLLQSTTIATLASQTSFTLSAGSTDDDAYNNATIVVEDASTAVQKCMGIIKDYDGGTKTITLLADPGVFTMATTDKVYIIAEGSLKSTTAASLVINCIVDTVVNTHTPTTTEFQSDTITEATADHFNGRVVIFTSGVLAGQAAAITDYVAVGGIGQFTVAAMTEAPANNDSFVIV